MAQRRPLRRAEVEGPRAGRVRAVEPPDPGIRCSGTPIATSSWQAGMQTPEIISDTGCSTCSRGFTSRKLYSFEAGL